MDNSWTEGKSESTWLKIKAEMVAVEEVRDSVAEVDRDLEAVDVRMEEDSEATEAEVEEAAVEVVAAVVAVDEEADRPRKISPGNTQC